ncbi:unnamed protein product [Orchesella dallaii]|uniref:U3 small nucleolar RNA-associated protein 6 N-terminal domain-containing protein n=1 Tax=Orchesella dallaii TaxID=48710 RepID=A0ABP1S0G3_9HEXA
MAEFVQLRKEKWSESLEALKELELFQNEDLRLLVRKINDFEYKIQSPNRTLADVLAYIQFEFALLKDLQQRRREVNQYDRDRTDDIDRFICLEIVSQFGSAEINFKHRVDFWDAKLKFLAGVVTHHDFENEFNNTLSKALGSCCRFSFDFYKFVVNCQWSFLNLPQYVALNKRKRNKIQPRDDSKIMITIREVTRGALRDFPRHPEVYIWVCEPYFL